MLTALRREQTSLTAVPALQFEGSLYLVAHLISYRVSKEWTSNKTRLHLQLVVTERRSITPDGYTSHAQRYRTAVEDSSQWGFKFSLKFPWSWKDYNTEDSREQFLIPFLLQTSLFLFFLLHNSMSKEQYGEASKCRNKKQE